MKNPPSISDAEWDVMKVIWKHTPCSAQTVIDALRGPTGWSDGTIKTLLNRLVKKGALRFEKAGRAYTYFAAATEADCRAAETESFLDRVFDGSLSPLIAHFAKARRLDKRDLEELEALVRKAKKP